MVVSYFPGALDELFTAQVVSGFSFFFKCPLNDILGCNTRMVSSRNPESVISLHAVIADDDILQSVIEAVTHVKNAGYIWRRDDDCIFDI